MEAQMMREITFEEIAQAVEQLCIKAAVDLPCDTARLLEAAEKSESSPAGKQALADIIENFKYARTSGIPICQDTGMAVIFAEIGQEVHISGGLFNDAVNEGVRRGYEKGYLRKSIVSDPFRRINTNDNTPAVIHTTLIAGEKISLTVSPKGFGSENMSSMKMLLPSDSIDAAIDFIVETAAKAGSNPCPPIIVGVGLGGTVEQAAILAKKALLRDADTPNPDPFYAEAEQKALDKINALGIGPCGYGGKTTALAVNINTFPTHIAGLPCVVNIGCHATRHAGKEL